MVSSNSLRRIVICQGTIQTVTALAVLRSREAVPKGAITYNDRLVIHGLFSPPDQIEQFATFIRTLAQHERSWVSITYLPPEQLQEWSENLQKGSTNAVFQALWAQIGVETADEIYSAINWQFGNELLLNAYASAQRICYGDSIGFYVPANASINRQVRTSKGFMNNPLIKGLKTLLAPLRPATKTPIALEPLEFHLGCFFLPDLMGDVPPMKSVVIDRHYFLQTCIHLSQLVNTDYVTQFRDHVSGSPVSILLTSNFSEAKRMTQENEIEAYRQFLIKTGIELNEILVIKPHPRDNKGKIQALKDSLSDLYAEIVLLIEPENFYTPFELFFIRAFLNDQQTLRQPVRAFAFSTACFSLKWLFGVGSQIGFGSELVSTFFFDTHQSPRIEHEAQLKAGLENLD